MNNIIPQVIKINNNNVILINKKSKLIAIECFILKNLESIDKNNIGINHFLEHIIVNSYKKCKNKCLNYFKKIGIKNNAYVTYDYINYNISGFKTDIELMLTYLINIINNPIFNNTIIDFEKNAVINELLINIDNLNYDIYDIINKHIFSIDAFKYLNDYKLQLKNLKNFNYKNLYNYYKNNYSKIIYIISGDIDNNIINILKKKLPNTNYNINKINLNHNNIFNIKKDIIFVKNNKRESSIITFNFTCNYIFNDKKLIYLDVVKYLLKNILNEKLRYENKYIYSVIINIDKLLYGTIVNIILNTENKNVVNTINKTIDIINKLKITELKNIKKTYLIDYYSKEFNIYDYIKYYGIQYLYNIYNNNNIIFNNNIKNTILKIKNNDIKSIMNEVFNFDNCLIVYSNKEKTINKNKFIF